MEAGDKVATRSDDEAGLSLVEMMVAMLVTGIILMAMATVAIASLHAVQSSERVVHATQLGNEVLEGYLATEYDDLGLYQGDATAVFGGTSFEGDQLVLFPDPVTPAPEVPEAETTIERQGITYTVRTAVVWVDDDATPEAQDYKRLVVQLDWTVRGRAQSAQVEALRSPAPGEQPLTVTINPDVIDISDSGTISQSFTIEVVARLPQQSVRVEWTDRNGGNQSRNLNDVEDGLRWTRTISGTSPFANGGTLFKVTGTAKSGAQQEVTTLGRVMFFQSLALPPARTTLTPNVLSYHPVTGYCEDEVKVVSEAVGAIFSDPMSLAILDDEGEPVETLTMVAEDTLTDGTRFERVLDLTDLGIEDGDSKVDMRLTVTRPTGITEVTATLDVELPLTVLEEGVSCPA